MLDIAAWVCLETVPSKKSTLSSHMKAEMPRVKKIKIQIPPGLWETTQHYRHRLEEGKAASITKWANFAGQLVRSHRHVWLHWAEVSTSIAKGFFWMWKSFETLAGTKVGIINRNWEVQLFLITSLFYIQSCWKTNDLCRPFFLHQSHILYHFIFWAKSWI